MTPIAVPPVIISELVDMASLAISFLKLDITWNHKILGLQSDLTQLNVQNLYAIFLEFYILDFFEFCGQLFDNGIFYLYFESHIYRLE